MCCNGCCSSSLEQYHEGPLVQWDVLPIESSCDWATETAESAAKEFTTSPPADARCHPAMHPLPAEVPESRSCSSPLHEANGIPVLKLLRTSLCGHFWQMKQGKRMMINLTNQNPVVLTTIYICKSDESSSDAPHAILCANKL